MKKIGKSTFELKNAVFINNSYSIVGRKEGEGPFGKYFSEVVSDDKLGRDTFEKAEREMHTRAVQGVMQRANMVDSGIDLLVSGDLMNQLVTSNYMAKEFDIPYLGIYSACSSFTEALILDSSFIEAGGVSNAIAIAGSHFSAAERQYRNPLEFGNQRQTYSQWTVTGSGATLLSKTNKNNSPKITKFTIGKVQDYGIKDIANMGAAMAPAIDIIGP